MVLVYVLWYCYGGCEGLVDVGGVYFGCGGGVDLLD